MSDIEEPPAKITKYQLESQYLEGEVMEEGQEEWLSEDILTDDDYPAGDQDQERSDSNLGNTSQDETLASANNSIDYLENIDSQDPPVEALDQTDPNLDQSDPNLDQTDPNLDQTDPNLDQTDPDETDPDLDETDPNLDQTEQGNNSQGNDNYGPDLQSLVAQISTRQETGGGDKERKNIEDTLNDFENSRKNQTNDLPEDLNAFLIRKTDGKVLQEVKVQDKKEEEKPSEDDGNDTDDLLRMLGEGGQKKKKALKVFNKEQDNTTDDDEYILEQSRMKTLKVAKNALVRKYPATKAVPEDDMSTDDEATEKPIHVRRKEPVKRSTILAKNTSLAKNTVSLTKVNTSLTKGNTSITKVNTSLTKGNTSLTKVNTSLTKGNTILTRGNTSLTKGNTILTRGNTSLTKVNTSLAKSNTSSTKDITSLAKSNTSSTKDSTSLTKVNTSLTKNNSNVGRSLIKQSVLTKPPVKQAVDVAHKSASSKPSPAPSHSTPLKQYPKRAQNQSLLKPVQSDDVDEDDFIEEHDVDLDENFAEKDVEPTRLQKQRIMRPEQMDEEVPTDADSLSEDDSLYDELPSSDSDNMDDWFTLDIRAERAGDYLPLLGERAYQLLLEEKRRVTVRLETLKKSLSSLTRSGREQADQLSRATASVAELDAMLRSHA